MGACPLRATILKTSARALLQQPAHDLETRDVFDAASLSVGRDQSPPDNGSRQLASYRQDRPEAIVESGAQLIVGRATGCKSLPRTIAFRLSWSEFDGDYQGGEKPCDAGDRVARHRLVGDTSVARAPRPATIPTSNGLMSAAASLILWSAIIRIFPKKT